VPGRGTALNVAENLRDCSRAGESVICLPEPPGDASLVQIVRRHLHPDAVASGNAHPSFPHFSAEGGEHQMFVIQFHPEHCSRENSVNPAFDFNTFFFQLIPLVKLPAFHWWAALPQGWRKKMQQNKKRPGNPGLFLVKIPNY
jgi:hypothetical protein